MAARGMRRPGEGVLRRPGHRCPRLYRAANLIWSARRIAGVEYFPRRSASFASMQITVIAELAGLKALTAEWEELAAAAVEPNPFYEPWMALPALEAFGTKDLAFVAVRQSG